jgi:hypothetical protein
VKPPLLRRHASSGADASNDEETEAAGVSVVNPNELLDQVMLRPTQEAFHKAITTFANRPGKFKRGSVDFVYTTLQVCIQWTCCVAQRCFAQTAFIAVAAVNF